MRLFAVLLVTALSGCTTAPFKVFLGEYTKEGVTERQLKEDRDNCSRESMDLYKNTAARGQVASYLMQRNMYECMKKRGYESPHIHPDAYRQAL
jgi:hypothetical protein